jgi:hypothetical protein
MGAATCRIRAHARNKGAQGQWLPLSRPPHLIMCWIWRFMVTKNRMNLGGSKGRPKPAREPQALAGVGSAELVGRSAARLGGRECAPVEHEDGPVHGEVEQGDQGGHRPKQHRLGAVPPAEQEHDTARRRSSACSSAQSSGPWPACPVHRGRRQNRCTHGGRVVLHPAGPHQNLNSGRRRTNGRNSSSDLLGRVGPSSSGLICGLRSAGETMCSKGSCSGEQRLQDRAGQLSLQHLKSPRTLPLTSRSQGTG